MNRRAKSGSSWEGVSQWYDGLVGKKGQYYHQNIVLPGVMKLLDISSSDANVLDLGCGQGVLARALPKGTGYCGVDASKTFVDSAKKMAKVRAHRFVHADACGKLTLEDGTFTHATIVLALQNMAKPTGVLGNAARYLKVGGRLVIVLNHPSFRIPRHTGWAIDRDKKMQSRRVDSYMSNLKIPIQAHPSKGKDSPVTLSYHYPLHRIVGDLAEAGFSVVGLEEWCSDKTSEGGAAKMENRARNEIPMFMAIVAEKRSG